MTIQDGDKNMPSAEATPKKDHVYSISWQRSLSHPVYAFLVTDIREDGYSDLVVSTLYGLHLFSVCTYISPLTYLIILAPEKNSKASKNY